MVFFVLGLWTPLQASPEKETGENENQLSLQQQDKIRQENFAKFLSSTVELRKELAKKQAENRALLFSENPNQAKITALTEQVYQLMNTIQAKAQEAGIGPELTGGTASCCQGGAALPQGKAL